MLRRSFLSSGPGFAALFGLAPQTGASSRFDSARYAQDAWYDELPGRHRVCFDTWTAPKFAEAAGFTRNYYAASKDGYGIADRDLAVLMVVRHQTAPFAFTDAIWAKYGQAFSDRMGFMDPKTHQVPTANPYAAELAALVKQGLHLAVCNMTTRAYTRILADQGRGDAEVIYKELTANTIGPSHFVPAGTLAVTRAQEHGYVLVSVG